MKIYAPSLHLFAFITEEGLDSDFQTFDNSQKVQEYIETTYFSILKKIFKENPEKEIKKKIQLNPHPTSQFILANNKKYRLIKQQDDFPIQAVIYPLKISDSYALNLSLEGEQKFGKDAIEIQQLKKLNPDNCLNIKTYLGKIILLTVFINDSQKPELDKIQKECLNTILPPENQPSFYTKTELFNSDVFIYGNPKKKNQNKDKSYQQVWLIFFTQQENRDLFEESYWDFPPLFLEFHKIVNAFHYGKKHYKLADKEIDNLGKIIKNVKEEYGLNSNKKKETLPKINLDLLKDQLKTILTKNLKFSEILRKLELSQNTLSINLYDYQKSCEQLQTKIDDDLSLLKSFSTKEFASFEKEIQANIKYVSQDSLLIQEAVSTIRALIEIDQAQSDRKMQQLKEQQLETQEESDRQLQITLAAVGTGMAVGGIIASSSGQVTTDNPLYFPWEPEASRVIHPFAGFVSLSIIGGLIAAWIAVIIFNWWNQKKSK